MILWFTQLNHTAKHCLCHMYISSFLKSAWHVWGRIIANWHFIWQIGVAQCNWYSRYCISAASISYLNSKIEYFGCQFSTCVCGVLHHDQYGHISKHFQQLPWPRLGIGFVHSINVYIKHHLHCHVLAMQIFSVFNATKIARLGQDTNGQKDILCTIKWAQT